MRITYFIKNYPCTIFLFVLLFISILTILTEGKVYATNTKNTSGCEEKCIICTSFTSKPDISCSDRNSWKCECQGQDMYIVCDQQTIIKCCGTKSSGCSSVPCQPSDCTTETKTSCGTCILYKVDRTSEDTECDGNRANNCGKCIYNGAIIKDYIPSSEVYCQ